jgi:membrane protein implicated in regulation of membrane protease activity
MTSESRPFDRETLLDLTVNAIPLGIMLFFVGVFIFVNPFGQDLGATAIQLTIVVVTFIALAILTYVSGKAISESEKELEEMDGLEVVSESVGAETEVAAVEEGADEEADVEANEADDEPAAAEAGDAEEDNG